MRMAVRQLADVDLEKVSDLLDECQQRLCRCLDRVTPAACPESDCDRERGRQSPNAVIGFQISSKTVTRNRRFVGLGHSRGLVRLQSHARRARDR